VPVGERSATPIALVIHELATNAVKYGALAVPGGEVDIMTETDKDAIIITWTERGGPPVAVPQKYGFRDAAIGDWYFQPTGWQHNPLLESPRA